MKRTIPLLLQYRCSKLTNAVVEALNNLFNAYDIPTDGPVLESMKRFAKCIGVTTDIVGLHLVPDEVRHQGRGQ